MPGRIVTLELPDEQAAVLDMIAAYQNRTPEQVLHEAIAHGIEVMDLPGDPHRRKQRTPSGPDTDDDMPL
jgi:hypothetical protein